MKLVSKDELKNSAHYDDLVICTSGELDSLGKVIFDKYIQKEIDPYNEFAGALAHRLVKGTNLGLFGFLWPKGQNPIGVFQHKWSNSSELNQDLVGVSIAMLAEYAETNSNRKILMLIPSDLRNNGIVNKLIMETPHNIFGYSYS